jgi:hypothetical protein
VHTRRKSLSLPLSSLSLLLLFFFFFCHQSYWISDPPLWSHLTHLTISISPKGTISKYRHIGSDKFNMNFQKTKFHP